MEEIKTEEQMKEIQEMITYYHELLERNEMLETRNQAMLKKIRQEKEGQAESRVMLQDICNHSSCGYDIWIWNGGWKMSYVFNYNGILKKHPRFADLLGCTFKKHN